MSDPVTRPPFQSPVPATMAVPAPLTVRLPPLREEADATPCLADEEHGPPAAAIAPAHALSRDGSSAVWRQPFLPVCEMCGISYDPSERMDDMPFCSYECASGGGSHAPAEEEEEEATEVVCRHNLTQDELILIGACWDPIYCECACAGCAYERLPLCYTCRGRNANVTDGVCAECTANPCCDHCGCRVREPGLCDRCLREFQEEQRWATETCGDCRLKNRECRCNEDDGYGRGDESPPSGRPCPVCGCNFEGNDWYGVCSRSCARGDRWG